MTLKVLQFLFEQHHLPRHVLPPVPQVVLKQTANAIQNVAHTTKLAEPSSLLDLRSILFKFFRRFACVVAQLGKKLLKGQLQTFHGIFDDKTAASETVKARFKSS